MDDLPELPFEQVLSYLNLEDRLKARTVSRAWRNKFDRYPVNTVNTLCFSSRPRDFIFRKSRWVSGPFAENFISSTRFESFFDTYRQMILFSLKHLRLCDLNLSEGDQEAFARILNSFDQLEQLDIIRATFNQFQEYDLNLPKLTRLQIEEFECLKFTLKASRLREVRLLGGYETNPNVQFVHGESVERLFIDHWEYTDVKKLKNLQHLYVNFHEGINPTFLSSLKRLKEFHTNEPGDVSNLFEQKRRYDRVDLKIYLYGLLLNSPDDPATNAFRDSFCDHLTGESLVCLAENRWRLADQIPFYRKLHYSAIEHVAPALEVNLLKRFTDLNWVIVNHPVQNIERFLNLLKNCKNIVGLWFYCDQSQDLFDRLPEHCSVQKLTLWNPPSDQAFLFRLKHLIELYLDWPIDSETVRRAFEDLPAFSSFYFVYGQKTIIIETCHPKKFKVSIDGKKKKASDLNAAIELITGKNKPSRPKKRKAEALE